MRLYSFEDEFDNTFSDYEPCMNTVNWYYFNSRGLEIIHQTQKAYLIKTKFNNLVFWHPKSLVDGDNIYFSIGFKFSFFEEGSKYDPNTSQVVLGQEIVNNGKGLVHAANQLPDNILEAIRKRNME